MNHAQATVKKVKELLERSASPLSDDYRISLGLFKRIKYSFFSLSPEEQHQELIRIRDEELSTAQYHFHRLDDPEYRANNANIATTISGEFLFDRQLEHIFESFGLNSKDPWEWRRLLGIISIALFPSRRPAGRRPTWDGIKYYELIFQVDEFMQRNPGLSLNSAFAAIAKKDARGKGTGANSETAIKRKTAVLKAAYRKARNPAHNELLNRQLDQLVADLEPDTLAQDWKKSAAKLYIDHLLLLHRARVSGEKITETFVSPDNDGRVR